MNRKELCSEALVALSPVLTERECASLIARSEQHGYKGEPPPAGARCAVADPDLAELLWSRLGSVLVPPQHQPGGHLLPQQLFHRFDARQRLLPGPAGRGDTEADPLARFVVLLYLNEGYEGGETICYPHHGPIHIQPTRGLALVVPAYLICEEMPVVRGRKYLLRAEVVMGKESG
jgi:hypothetical protein